MVPEDSLSNVRKYCYRNWTSQILPFLTPTLSLFLSLTLSQSLSRPFSHSLKNISVVLHLSISAAWKPEIWISINLTNWFFHPLLFEVHCKNAQSTVIVVKKYPLLHELNERDQSESFLVGSNNGGWCVQLFKLCSWSKSSEYSKKFILQRPQRSIKRERERSAWNAWNNWETKKLQIVKVWNEKRNFFFILKTDFCNLEILLIAHQRLFLAGFFLVSKLLR